MKKKVIFKNIIAMIMCLVMLVSIMPQTSLMVNAATTYSVDLTSLGQKGTVKIGSKTKSGTWWQMELNGKEAFCMDLGYTCHDGNKYEAVKSYKWNQDTTGAKNSYYAKIIRWYVIDKKRSKKGYVMAQTLIWSVENGRNSKSQLKDVIEQVQKNIKIDSSKTVEAIYKQIFEPSGDYTSEVTYWEKTGNSTSYQKLMTVDAEHEPVPFEPKSVQKTVAYRQRLTIHKKDEEGKPVSGIQFTLKVNNIDDLYSFAVTDRDGTDAGNIDDDEDTAFSMTGHTDANGVIGFRMTYKYKTIKYYYYSNDDLEAMTDKELKEAKKHLTDDLELEEGIDFHPSMRQDAAKELLEFEIHQMESRMDNEYVLTEDNTGDRTDLSIDPEYATGKSIILDKSLSWKTNDDGSWPDMAETDPALYSLAYQLNITNNYKRASVKVVKVDKYSNDKKPHGEADLNGAEFMLYEDQGCTRVAMVFDANGNPKDGGVYTVKNGSFSTDYLKSGVTYYLKETKSPKGYTLSNDVIPITSDTSSATAEYTSDLATVEYGNQPVLGKVAIQKYYSDGESGTLEPEPNTTFQVYLTSKGSYDKCDDYERATIKTDANGYGITKDLYIGKYTVHQVDSGDVDAIPVKDFNVEVSENGKTYTYTLNNKLFKAFLRIIKKDGNTEKTVLKEGTTYQIYKLTGDKEELVEQSYVNGNKMVKVDKFVTDETGEIMTVQALPSATYRIYEVDSASGLHKTEKYIEVTINSKSDNYEGYIDEDGNWHAVITLTYTNNETSGKLKIYKTGEMLTGYDNGKFIYENRYLKGAVFEVYASDDIVTQDNQGTNWYDKDELVATITTGEGAVFTKECKDITDQKMDENGVVSITVPLGKYHIKEVKTPYGYIISDKEWDVDFTWDNYEDEYVINSNNESDDLGVINVVNALAKTQVSLLKKDEKDEKPIQGATFGLYTRNDIYNVFGEKIVDAGTQITTLITNGAGTAVSNLQLPLMSEGYKTANSEENIDSASEKSDEKDNTSQENIEKAEIILDSDGKEIISSDDENADKKESEKKPTQNSGDYYLKEISISGSYYMRDTEYPVHLEYKDQNTKVIAASVEAVNTHTETTVSKMDITGSAEVPGCDLEIKDKDGNVIIKWTSRVQGTIVLSDKLGSLGYRNVAAYLDEKGNLQVSGLIHDMKYTLTETRPADGFVTSDDIMFQLIEGENGQTIVGIFEGEEMKPKQDHIVLMYDDTTKIRLLKIASDSGEGLAKAKFEVYDSEKNKVFEFETSDEGYDVTGILAVGKTYTFKETEAPEGYKIAKPVEYTILDTSEVQQIVVKDEKKPKPKVPQTGGVTPFAITLIISVTILVSGLWFYYRKRDKHEKRRL